MGDVSIEVCESQACGLRYKRVEIGGGTHWVETDHYQCPYCEYEHSAESSGYFVTEPIDQ